MKILRQFLTLYIFSSKLESKNSIKFYQKLCKRYDFIVYIFCLKLILNRPKRSVAKRTSSGFGAFYKRLRLKKFDTSSEFCEEHKLLAIYILILRNLLVRGFMLPMMYYQIMYIHIYIDICREILYL